MKFPKNKNKTALIYQIRNKITNKVYVGWTNNPKTRVRTHFRLLLLNKHHSSKLQRSYNKHGIDHFVWEIIENDIDTVPTALEKEALWISKLNSYENGYNMTPGGEGVSGHFGSKHWNAIPIYQYNLQGVFMNRFDCAVDAEKCLEIKYLASNICKVKWRDDVSHGFIWSTKFKQPWELCKLHRYKLDGNYVDSFYNSAVVEDTLRFLGNNVDNATDIANKTSYDHQWKSTYLGPKIKEIIKGCGSISAKLYQSIPVEQIDKITGEVVAEHCSVAEAARSLKRDYTNISACINGNTKTAYGYRWKKKSEEYVCKS